MATYDQLFGKREFAEKRPSAPKWNNVGDYFDAVVTGDPEVAPQLDVNNSWQPMYLEQQDDSSWKPTKESDLTRDKNSPEGVIALTQIIVPVTLLDGTPATFYFDNPAKKEALEAAMKDSEIGLEAGVGIRMQRVEQKNKKNRAFAWEVMLAESE